MAKFELRRTFPTLKLVHFCACFLPRRRTLYDIMLQMCEYSIAQEFYIYSDYSQKPLTIVVKLWISDNCGGPLDKSVNI